MKLNRRAMVGATVGLAAASCAVAEAKKEKVVYNSDEPDGDIPLYSEVVAYGDLVFVAGWGVNDSDKVGDQTTTVLDQIEAALQRAGSRLENALKVNVYLHDLNDYGEMNEAYRGRFGDKPPVRATVAVAAIPLDGCLVEIEVTAHR